MDKVVSINHTKENVIEFDLTMEGVENKDVEVMLMVDAKDMTLGFSASKKEKDTWSVKLPKLPMLERTAYKFHVMVHADGYHFRPFDGTLNVVGSAEVYSSDPKNVTLKPDGKEEPKKEKKVAKEEKKVSETWRQSEKPIEQIAREMLEKQKFDPAEVDKKVEEVRAAATEADVVEGTSKDAKVLAILEEAGIRPHKKKPRISFFKSGLLNG